MKRYINIYRQFVIVNVAEVMAYRGRFIGDSVSALMWGLFHLVMIYILAHRVTTVYGWKREELYLLIATFSIMWGVFRLLFMENFRKFPDLILKGQLDSLLIKPVDSQFWVTTRKIGFDEIVRIIMGILFMFYIINTYNLKITWLHTFFYINLLAFAIISIYSLWFVFSTFLIWYPRLTNLRELLSYLSGIMKYPPEVFKGLGNTAVIFLTPILFVIAVPTKALTGKIFTFEMLWFTGFSVGFFLVARAFWKFALKSYTSVNS